jgi:WD40 repeat protein
MSLFTGDILALAATDKAVFTAGADGSLRRWALGKLGELSEAEVRDKAHDGRITALAVSGSLLFSAGYDGDIKVRRGGGDISQCDAGQPTQDVPAPAYEPA